MIEASKIRTAYEVFGITPKIRKSIILNIHTACSVDRVPGCGLSELRSVLTSKGTKKITDDFTAIGKYADAIIVRLAGIADRLRDENGKFISVYAFYQLPVLETTVKMCERFKQQGMMDELIETPISPLKKDTWVEITRIPRTGWTLVFPLMVAGAMFESLAVANQNLHRPRFEVQDIPEKRCEIS
jgi:hypothetical protein